MSRYRVPGEASATVNSSPRPRRTSWGGFAPAPVGTEGGLAFQHVGEALELRRDACGDFSTCRQLGRTPLVCGGRRGVLELELGVDRDANGYFFVTGDSDGRAVRVRVSGNPFSAEPLRSRAAASVSLRRSPSTRSAPGFRSPGRSGSRTRNMHSRRNGSERCSSQSGTPPPSLRTSSPRPSRDAVGKDVQMAKLISPTMSA